MLIHSWYGATGDTEWYSPEAINTTGGSLVISMTEKETHYLNFQSGMLQSWNKFCFQGGYIEFNVLQPGSPATSGYWPAVWLMGNLGRPGYLGSTDGMWPYSYQCELTWQLSASFKTDSLVLCFSLRHRHPQKPKLHRWHWSRGGFTFKSAICRQGHDVIFARHAIPSVHVQLRRSSG